MVTSSGDRQVSLLELLLDDLPAANSLLTVDRGDTAAVDLEVWGEAVRFAPQSVV
jgi:phosphatidate phosphatase APP1